MTALVKEASFGYCFYISCIVQLLIASMVRNIAFTFTVHPDDASAAPNATGSSPKADAEYANDSRGNWRFDAKNFLLAI